MINLNYFIIWHFDQQDIENILRTKNVRSKKQRKNYVEQFPCYKIRTEFIVQRIQPYNKL